MYNEWSLDVFYQGVNDPKLMADMERLETVISEHGAAVAALDAAKPVESLRRAIEIKEELTVLVRRLAGYFMLRRSANSADTEGAGYLTKVQAMAATTARDAVVFEKFAGSLDNLEQLLEEDDLLRQYKFHFREIRKAVSHKMGDEAEAVFARMDISGGRAWGEMVSHLTSNVSVDWKGKKLSLAALRGLAQSNDAADRKAAFELELSCYGGIKDAVAFGLNSIKAQANLEAELRGFADPLDMTLDQSRMQRSTLDAMFEAIREALPKFHAYLRHKAKLLGHENGMPWYDVMAPMGSNEGVSFTVPEAHAYLVEHFKPFAPDLAELVDRAFKEEWIDFYPRTGKVGGAFCSNLPFIGQSRVLTNFTGSMRSVITIAHELGHAYHGQQIQDHRPLNTAYTMPVAETASTFNELIIMNDAIAKTEGQERIGLIESQIQDCTQIIVDIYSRFLFEDEVIRRRKDTFLYADALEEIMLNAQRQAYGDGLDPDCLHPYMWCCKPHYYRSNLSYYNFPYAFGGLFARGLYARYLEDGEAFLPKYRALLHATTVDTVENVAGIAGLDLSDLAFWRASLKVITDKIDLFIEETSK